MSKLTLANVQNLQNESAVVTILAQNNAATSAAMENTLSLDGTSPNTMKAELDMNSNRIINLPDAISDQEPATYSQLTDRVNMMANGAVVQGSYVTVNAEPALAYERVLSAGTNIGLTDTGANGEIIVSVNDPELDALAAVTSAADTVPYFTGLGTANTTSLTPYARTLLADADAASARATLGSVIGTDVQPHDTDLDALAATATTGLYSVTGSGTSATRTITGTANEVTLTNGDGVAGNPVVSLPSALTFTGKTVTGGTYNSPSLVTPNIGVATATSVNKVTVTTPATSATLTIADGKTLSANNTQTFAGTDGTTITFQGTDTYVGRATTDTLTNKTFDTAGTGNVFKINGTQVSTITGTGSAVLASSPALLGTPTAPTASTGTATTQLATTAFVASAVGSTLPIGQNVVINPDFRINQRVYASGTALGAGVYAHDRWKAGASGVTYTFTQLDSSTQINITAGSLQQVIETFNIVGGNYVLSWTGTAQARVGLNGAAPSGSYASSPITFSQSAANLLTIEFDTGTLGTVKCETGLTATTFVSPEYSSEYRKCLRYCELVGSGMAGVAYTSTGAAMTTAFKVRKRVTPSVVLVNGSGALAVPGVSQYNVSTISGNNSDVEGAYILCTTTTSMTVGAFVLSITNNNGFVRFEAEL